MPSDDAHRCRVCGWWSEDPPWGEDGETSSFDICECCGTTFGYEDISPVAARANRARWVADGAPWFRGSPPADWDLAAQLGHVPEAYR